MRRTDSLLETRGARGFEKQAALRHRCFEETKIERAFRAATHRARENEVSRLRGILQKNGQAIDQQRLRDAIEHRAQQRFESHFVRQRPAELDERTAVVKAVTIEKVIQASLHPVAQRLE